MSRPSWMRLPDTYYSTAELKSALQKFVRRRDARAYDVARHLLYDHTSTQALLRRLPTIAIEEGTLGVASEAVELMVQYGQRDTSAAATADAGLRVIARIMATPLDKDPAYLENWPRVADSDALPAECEAAALWQAWSEARGREVLDATLRVLPDSPARGVVVAMQRRATLGVLEGDLKMFCGVALALVNRVRRGEPNPVLPVLEEPVPPSARLETLPWWTLDPHVAVGKKALKVAMKALPYADWSHCFRIWFRLSSDVLEGYVKREGWRLKRLAEEISSEDRAWWERAEPIVRQMIEADLARRTPGPMPADYDKEVQQMALTLDDPKVQALREERRRLRDQSKALQAQDREARLRLRAAKQARRADASAQRATDKRLREARRGLRTIVRSVLGQDDPRVVEAAVAAIRAQVGDPDAAA